MFSDTYVVLNYIIPTIVVALFTAMAMFAGLLLVRLRKSGLDYIRAITPDHVDRWIDEATANAAKIVELLDANGRLTEWIEEIKVKSEDKLNLATDIAIKQLETRLSMMGISVDIPTDAIRDAIQKYIFDNPDLFPAKSKQDKSE